MNIVFERTGTARRKNGLGSGIAASLSVRGSGISSPAQKFGHSILAEKHLILPMYEYGE